MSFAGTIYLCCKVCLMYDIGDCELRQCTWKVACERTSRSGKVAMVVECALVICCKNRKAVTSIPMVMIVSDGTSIDVPSEGAVLWCCIIVWKLTKDDA